MNQNNTMLTDEQGVARELLESFEMMHLPLNFYYGNLRPKVHLSKIIFLHQRLSSEF